MTTDIDFSVILQAVTDLPFVRDYIHNGNMASILSSISDVEVEAAKDALKNKNLAHNPVPHVREAATHLRSAHFALFNFLKRENEFNRMTMTSELMVAARKDVWVLSNLMLCHIYLNEESIARQYSNNLKFAWVLSSEPSYERTVGAKAMKSSLELFLEAGFAMGKYKNHIGKQILGLGAGLTGAVLGGMVYPYQVLISKAISLPKLSTVNKTPEPPSEEELETFIKSIARLDRNSKRMLCHG